MQDSTGKIEEYLRQIAERDRAASDAKQGAAMALAGSDSPVGRQQESETARLLREVVSELRSLRQDMRGMQQPRRYG